MTSSAEGTASTGVYFRHYSPQQILHDIAEPQWLPHATATTHESRYVDTF